MIAKPQTRNGCRHDACGTTLKYTSNGSCVYCCRTARTRIRYKGREIIEADLDAMDAALLDSIPRRTVRIERSCRLPLVVEIPDPPLRIINIPWESLASGWL